MFVCLLRGARAPNLPYLGKEGSAPSFYKLYKIGLDHGYQLASFTVRTPPLLGATAS